jgi:hypothetical protein
MSDELWDEVQDIHLKAAFKLSQAAWPKASSLKGLHKILPAIA